MNGSKTKGFYRIVHNNFVVPPFIPTLKDKCNNDDVISFYLYHPSQEIYYSKGLNKNKKCSTRKGEDFDCSDKEHNANKSDHTNDFKIDVDDFR